MAKTKERPAPATTPTGDADPPETWDAERVTAEIKSRDDHIEQLAAMIAEKDETIAERDATIAQFEAGTFKEAPATTLKAAGETRTVTYLGRPELIQRDSEGDPVEEDVYLGHDGEGGSFRLAVGESTVVSAKKAAQLEADFPDAFDID